MFQESLKGITHNKFDMLLRQCYIPPIISIKLYEGKKWGIQKNIEAVESKAQKKEEQREKIRKNNLKWSR